MTEEIGREKLSTLSRSALLGAIAVFLTSCVQWTPAPPPGPPNVYGVTAERNVLIGVHIPASARFVIPVFGDDYYVGADDYVYQGNHRRFAPWLVPAVPEDARFVLNARKTENLVYVGSDGYLYFLHTGRRTNDKVWIHDDARFVFEATFFVEEAGDEARLSGHWYVGADGYVRKAVPDVYPIAASAIVRIPDNARAVFCLKQEGRSYDFDYSDILCYVAADGSVHAPMAVSSDAPGGKNALRAPEGIDQWHVPPEAHHVFPHGGMVFFVLD